MGKKWFTLPQMYGSTISFAYFDVFFLEIPTAKNISTGGEGKGLNAPSGKKFFTIVIFRKNTSKYAKLMVELYICDNLNQIY